MSFAATLPTSRLNVRAAIGFGLAALALGAGSATIAASPMAHRATAPATTTSASTTAPVTTTPTTSTTDQTSTTTSTNGSSTAFGQQVKAQVAVCKAAAAAAGKHGIGPCVSAWVTAHNPGHHGSASSGG